MKHMSPKWDPNMNPPTANHGRTGEPTKKTDRPKLANYEDFYGNKYIYVIT